MVLHSFLFLVLSGFLFGADDLEDLSQSINEVLSTIKLDESGETSPKVGYIAHWLVRVDEEKRQASIAVKGANLRSGPATTHSVLRVGKEGDVFPYLGKDPSTGWIKLSLQKDGKGSQEDSSSQSELESNFKVSPGQTLSGIARKVYSPLHGNSRSFRLWPLIYVASDLSSVQLRVDQPLVVPELSGDARAQMDTILEIMIQSIHRLQEQLSQQDLIESEPLIGFLKNEYSQMVSALFSEFKEEYQSRLQEALSSNREEFYLKQLKNLETEVSSSKSLEELSDLSLRIANASKALTTPQGQQSIKNLEGMVSRRFEEISESAMEELESELDAVSAKTGVDGISTEIFTKKRNLGYRLFERKLELEELRKISGLESAVQSQLSRLDELKGRLGAPQGKSHPSVIRMNQGSRRALSLTVQNPRFKHWLNVAQGYFEKKSERLPAIENRYGEVIGIRQIIKAIIIQESAGVHRKGNGKITAGLNKRNGVIVSMDLGFGQINTNAHGDLKIRVSDVAFLISDQTYPYSTLVNRYFYNTGTEQGKKKVKANFENPMHNLHGVSNLLSQIFNFSSNFENTSGEKERLIKSLSSYNHGMYSSDYDIPWQDFVQKVAQGRGNYGEEVGVHYGIRLQLLLGLDPTQEEITYLKTSKGIRTMSSFYFRQVHDAYAYANFPEV